MLPMPLRKHIEWQAFAPMLRPIDQYNPVNDESVYEMKFCPYI
jgi:hypothetical protein